MYKEYYWVTPVSHRKLAIHNFQYRNMCKLSSCTKGVTCECIQMNFEISEGKHFFGSSLIYWGTKKQNSGALFKEEAKYVAAASCCAQLLWIKQQLEDFGVLTDTIPQICENTSGMNMAKNSIHHKSTKNKDVRHHYLRDNVEKRNVMMKLCETDDQLDNIFTKPMSKECFI